MLIRLRPYKYLHDRVHITMHNRAHILFNTNLTLQITERRRTSHYALTKGGIAGDITNTMLFMSWCSNFKSWRVRFTWYHVALCKATLHHWPRDLPGHAVSYCSNMWEFSLSRCNNKGRSPPAVDCSTDGYLWRGLMVRCARPFIATFASHKWLPVVAPYIYITATRDSASCFFLSRNVPGYCRFRRADWEVLMQRISTPAIQPLTLYRRKVWPLIIGLVP